MSDVLAGRPTMNDDQRQTVVINNLPVVTYTARYKCCSIQHTAHVHFDTQRRPTARPDDTTSDGQTNGQTNGQTVSQDGSTSDDPTANDERQTNGRRPVRTAARPTANGQRTGRHRNNVNDERPDGQSGRQIVTNCQTDTTGRTRPTARPDDDTTPDGQTNGQRTTARQHARN